MAEHEAIEEHMHHAQEPFDKVVAATMAIIAALLAVVSVLGLHFTTETLLKQQESADQWSFYQAKNIRRYTAQMAHDILSQMKAPSASIEKYAQDGEKYEKQMEEIQKEAASLKHESELAEGRSSRFHLGEVFLEIGIVLSSLAILTKRKPFYFGGAIFAVAGLACAATAFIN